MAINIYRGLFLAVITVLLLGLAMAGCDQGASSPPDIEQHPSKNTSAAIPTGIWLTEPPTGVTPIADLKQTATEGDEVVVHVVVGGRKKPIVDHRAVVAVVDAGVSNQCMLPGDSCDTPWDYCCESPEQLKPHLATIQIVDTENHPLAIDLPRVSEVKPLTVMIVKGKIGPRPDPDTLVINADRIFVESTP